MKAAVETAVTASSKIAACIILENLECGAER